MEESKSQNVMEESKSQNVIEESKAESQKPAEEDAKSAGKPPEEA